MKKVFPFIVILFFLGRSSPANSMAQTSATVINGSMINGIGIDRTMAGATTTNLPSGYAIKYYADSVVNNAMIALADSDIVLRALFPGMSRSSISLTTLGTGAATYSSATGILNIPTPYIAATIPVTRPINSTTFTISSTQPAEGIYYINIQCTASIGANSSGTAEFQYSTNGGSTWVSYARAFNSNTVSLAIVLNSVCANTTPIVVRNVPANALCRIVSTIVGTTTITYVYGFETY